MIRSTLHSRAFALVVTLLLTAMLAATGAGLSMTICAEGVHAGRVLADLRHELALDSLLTVLPDLLAQAEQADPGESPTRKVHISAGQWQAHAEIHEESSKRLMNTADLGAVAYELRALAARHGLPPDNVRPMPIHETQRQKFGDFLWYDQLIAATEFEEVFRWRYRPSERFAKSPKCWSDLVTFWPGQALSMEVETWVGSDVRRWYAVVEIDGDKVRVLYRGRI